MSISNTSAASLTDCTAYAQDLLKGNRDTGRQEYSGHASIKLPIVELQLIPSTGIRTRVVRLRRRLNIAAHKTVMTSEASGGLGALTDYFPSEPGILRSEQAIRSCAYP
eukprot:6177071-Pleurochrysis_carterae.AAC.2